MEVGGIREESTIGYPGSIQVRRDLRHAEEAHRQLDAAGAMKEAFHESGPTSEPLPNPAGLVAQWNLLRYPRVEADVEVQMTLADRAEARLGPVRYTREELAQIRRATARRIDPDVPPVPFAD
jgi:hypothetical protein